MLCSGQSASEFTALDLPVELVNQRMESVHKRTPALRTGLNLDRGDMLVFAQDVLRCITMKTDHFSLASPLLVELIDQERGLYWK